MDSILVHIFIPEIFLSLSILFQLLLNVSAITNFKNNYPILNIEIFSQCFFIFLCLILLFFNNEIEGYFFNFLFSNDLSSKLDPIKSVIHNVSEIIKTNPIGYLIVGTLLFVKKLKDLYRNHQQIVGFLTQVETILENSYRLNELIDKINEMMVIYTFNNQEYKNKYEELFNLEKEILNTNNDNSLKELNIKKKELFNGLLETANNNKQQYRAQVSDVQFDDLSKYIEPNKLIKQQLTEKIAEINKYLLGIATNDMLKTLSADMNIIKSGLIRLVNDEIELRNKKRFKWVRDRKRDWDRVNSRDSIMRKLNDDLIMMNSLFILVKFQMDFTLEYYKNKNLSPEEWNTLWKLITSFKEYTSYMIPSEVFMTIKYVNDLMEFNEAESKKAIMELGELIEMENLNEFGADRLILNYKLMDLLEFCEEAIGEENCKTINKVMDAYLNEDIS